MMTANESIAERIPQELVDEFASQLNANEDWHALASFGRVRKSWLSPSRRYLFDAVSVDSSNVDAFLEILTTPNCVIASYVHRLELGRGFASSKLLNTFLSRAPPLSVVKAL